jgi:nicotinate-nucleotide adenylyltransferase
MSYTIDTLLTVKSLMPDAEVFLLMGADSLRDFPYWRRPADICRAATPLVVNRAGKPMPNFEHLEGIVSPERLAEIESQQVEMPPVDISSSEIRRLIVKHGNWQEMVPENVGQYIRDHRLYLAQ